MTGRIVKIISNLYTVDVDNRIYECRARGLFRKDEITPLVGDIVEFDEVNNYILSIHDRKCELKRPNVANIDKCIIVNSLKKPDFSDYLLDKMLTHVVSSNIEPVIVFTKYDLLNNEEKKQIDSVLDYYKSIGYDTLINDNIDELKSILSGSVVVLTGQTGAGKSTLANKLDPTLNLKTDEISMSLGRGKHTTRHVELFKVDDFYLVDTPGFSSLDLEIDPLSIRFAFPEFPNTECKFNDCKHINEIGCRVKKLVDDGVILKTRYDNYRKMVEK